MIYEFGDCVVDSATQELTRDSELMGVEPQVMAVLLHLLSHRDRVVTKIELMDEVWGDRFVSESALTSRIKLARKACGDSGREQRIVKTVHGRGYRFIADVAESRSAGGVPAPAASARPTDRRTSTTTSVFGRESELAELEAGLETVAHGDRRAFYVTGEAGSGKTTVLAELLERNDGLESWFVARGRCLHTRSGVEPYFCLLDAISDLAHSEPDAVREGLERVAPSWLAQLPALVDDATAQRLERRLLGANPQRMLREGVEVFHELARSRPVGLFLEDLHWADDCTLDVLDLLVNRVDRAPILIVGTARGGSGPLAEVIAASVAGGRASEVKLSDLDREALEALTRERLGGVGPPAELVDVVERRCDGVPLFAQEILNTWIREGQVEIADGDVRITGALEQLEATVPATLSTLIDRKLADLDPTELDVLAAAATVGLTFDGASVAAGLQQEISETESVLSSMARRVDFIGAEGGSAWPDGTVSTSYSFSHQLLRDVVYERTPAGKRAQLHGLIGQALEQGHAHRVEEIAVALAEHFVQAGDDERSIEYLTRAGEQSAARSAHDHAIEFLGSALQRTLDMAPGEARDRTELRVRIALGPSLVASAGWIDEEVSANYERAMELGAEMDPGPEVASARYGLATVTELRGQFERTEELLSPLLSEGSNDLVMEAHELVACSTFHQGAFGRSERNAGMVLDAWDEEAYSVLMARLAEHPASSCNSWLSLSSWFLGRSDESVERAERAVRLGERNLYALATATSMRAMLHQLRDEPELCLQWASRTREVGREQDFAMRVIQADLFRGWALGVSGSPNEGMALIADGLERFRAAGARLNLAYYLALHADTQLHNDRPEEAGRLLVEATAAMEATTRSYFYESEILRLRARAVLAVGADDSVVEAREALAHSQAVAEAMGSPALMLRTVSDRLVLEREHGDPEPWLAHIDRLMSAYEGQAPNPDTTRARGLVAA